MQKTHLTNKILIYDTNSQENKNIKELPQPDKGYL